MPMFAIFELVQDLPKMHPYTKFGHPRSICSHPVQMNPEGHIAHFHSSHNILARAKNIYHEEEIFVDIINLLPGIKF